RALQLQRELQWCEVRHKYIVNQYVALLYSCMMVGLAGKCEGLRGIQKLNKGSLDLYVGNGNRAAVEAIGSFDLILPSRMVLVLYNCHFAPFITRGVISLSCLWDNGFLHKFMDYGAISVSKDNLFYFNAIPREGEDLPVYAYEIKL
ncbi:hypothetical protein Tco_1066071, partial [Tanacetum coccineum]